MYQAEIRGKLSRENENKEDILTSNVFSFFKYADRAIFLYPFIRSLGFNIQIDDARRAEFQFWPRFEDGTEPDLVLIIGDLYLLIESKYSSGFAEETEYKKHQLVREIKGGSYEAKNLKKEFRIIAITADYFNPEIDQAIPTDARGQFNWINWHKIAFFLYQTLENSVHIASETRLFAEDLYNLLLKKKLRNFEGIRVLSGFQRLQEPPESMFFIASTASYRGDFIGFLNAFENLKRNRKIETDLFFNKRTAVYYRYFSGFQEALKYLKLKCENPTLLFLDL